MGSKFIVSIYVACKQHVLLVNHIKQNAWVPIGGHIEPGETPLEAAKREILEEIGLQETEYGFNRLHTSNPNLGLGCIPGLLFYEEHPSASGVVHMNFSFLIHATRQEINPCREFTEVRWIDPCDHVWPVEVPANVRIILRHVAHELAASQSAQHWRDAGPKSST